MGRGPDAGAAPDPGEPVDAASARGDDGADDEHRRRSGSPWVTIGLAVILVVMLSVVGVRLLVSWNAAQEQSQRFCAGVGLMGPVGDTPQAVFQAWSGEDHPGDQLADWRRLPRSDNGSQGAPDDAVVYQDRRDPNRSVTITPTGSRWEATAACV